MSQRPKFKDYSNKVLRRRWKLIKKIGEGGFGQIYSAYDNETNSKVAVKLEMRKEDNKYIKIETRILRSMQDYKCVARYIYMGKKKEFFYLVMELLGPNLSYLRKIQPLKKFSLATTLKLASQIITAIEEFHQAGFIHRDIKASNFCLRPKRNLVTEDNVVLSRLVIIDFGLAKKYRSPNGQIYRQREKVGFRGTARYSSINTHLGKDQGRQDDLMSLFYVIIEFLKGGLPWERLKDKSEILKMKRKYQGATLCKDLPEEILKYYEYVDSLGYYDDPDYDYLRSLFDDLYKRKGYDQNTKYDWEAKSSRSGSGSSAKKPRKRKKKFDKNFLAEVNQMNRFVFPAYHEIQQKSKKGIKVAFEISKKSSSSSSTTTTTTAGGTSGGTSVTGSLKSPPQETQSKKKNEEKETEPKEQEKKGASKDYVYVVKSSTESVKEAMCKCVIF